MVKNKGHSMPGRGLPCPWLAYQCSGAQCNHGSLLQSWFRSAGRRGPGGGGGISLGFSFTVVDFLRKGIWVGGCSVRAKSQKPTIGGYRRDAPQN